MKWTGRGKEFKRNKLIYEGEYLNGIRDGKGKEYNEYSGDLIFEGEYKDGKKWRGEGKEWMDVKIEYLDGIKTLKKFS